MASAKHAEIRTWVETEIHSGRYVPGQKLPTESQLMEQFGVSRAPVQQAMRSLVEAGLVTRRRGAGSVVASSGLRSNLLQHLNPRSTRPEEPGAHRVIDVGVYAAGELPLVRGDLDAECPVAHLVRLKLSEDGKFPLALEKCAVDLRKVPTLLQQDLTALTTVAYFNSRGISVSKAITSLSAVLLSPVDAEALEVTRETPVIRQRRTVFDSRNRVIEIAEFFMHPTNLTLEVSQVDEG